MKLSQIVWILIILSLVFACQKKQEAEQKTEVTITEEPESITISNVTPFSYVCLPYIGSYDSHEVVIGSLMEIASAQGFELVGPMLGIYYNSPMDTPEDSLVWEIGFEVPDSLEVSDPLVVKKWLVSGINDNQIFDTFFLQSMIFQLFEQFEFKIMNVITAHFNKSSQLCVDNRIH